MNHKFGLALSERRNHCGSRLALPPRRDAVGVIVICKTCTVLIHGTTVRLLAATTLQPRARRACTRSCTGASTCTSRTGALALVLGHEVNNGVAKRFPHVLLQEMATTRERDVLLAGATRHEFMKHALATPERWVTTR